MKRIRESKEKDLDQEKEKREVCQKRTQKGGLGERVLINRKRIILESPIMKKRGHTEKGGQKKKERKYSFGGGVHHKKLSFFKRDKPDKKTASERVTWAPRKNLSQREKENG